MTQETISLEQFITEQQLVMSVVMVRRNPHMTDSPLPRNFECTLYFEGRGQRESLTVYFSQGSAHKKPPTLAEVLDCLASDASGIENARSFEEWASEYGFDTDSCEAERTYKICEKQARDLERFLGRDAYQQLVWNTERL